ncbi:Pex2/Pex12 amino terminal region [Apiospora aurea]|uniref:Pex2/Pex12 amino terminal region n=1 Tax=Apiospora aurea TaxID=335848 RepID=A0ABR1QQX1_9PEZI
MSSSSSFAQAQQRLAARRQARERENQARLTARRDESQAWSRAAKLPFALNRLGSSTLSAWELLSSREGTRPSFRVGQVDAELLDEELVDLLRGQVGDALKYLGGNIKDDWSAEILLGLRAYGWTKWEDWLLDQDNGYDAPSPRVQRLSAITSKLSTVHSMAAFVSFLVFLLHGRYRTLLDRLLRIRLVPPTSQVSREVSFEYLNRQLVWHAFTEFLLFVLPLVGINRWRRWLSRAWKKTKDIVHIRSDDASNSKQGEFAFLPERTCAICYQDQNSATSENEVLAAAASSGVVGSAQTDITNPYETIPCGCIYCYVCLATRLEREEGEGMTCLRCGELVKECKPWSGDVLEEVAKEPSSSPKRVGFADEIEEAAPEERDLEKPGRITKHHHNDSNDHSEEEEELGGDVNH